MVLIGREAPAQVEHLEPVLGRRERVRTTVGISLDRHLGPAEAPAPPDAGPDDVFDEHGQPVQLAGSAKQVDLRISPQDTGPFSLGHAADHAEHNVRIGSLVPGHDADPAVDLLLRVLTHGAGVVEDHIRGPPILTEPIAQTPKLAHNELGVQHVHLAAERLEKDGRGTTGLALPWLIRH